MGDGQLIKYVWIFAGNTNGCEKERKEKEIVIY